MNHLLIVPLNENVPESFLESFRQAGWRVSITAEVLCTKQLLQKGDVDGVIIEFNADGSGPERMRVLRYIHEFCPHALVVMMNSGPAALAAGENLVQALNMMDDTRSEVRPQNLDLYHLSPAQKRIAELVAQAYPNREIARRLKIKEQSVRNELSRIFKKMGVWNRVELALLMRTGHTERIAAGNRKEIGVLNPWPAEIRLPEEEPTKPSQLLA